MNDDDLSPRLTAMRNALIADVDASRTTGRAGTTMRHRRPTRAAVAAVVGAFLVGSGVTGALTAAALPGGDDDLERDLATTTRYGVVETNHGALVGRPAFSEGQGDLRVPLGPPPAGGDRVTFSWTCLTPGTVSVRIDDQVVWEPTACQPDRPGATTTTAPSWTMVAPPGTGQEAVTLALTTGSARVAVWASWARAPRIAEPSAQQAAETADGVVTLDEYTAAFNRLQACSAQAGTPMGVVPLTWVADGLWTGRPTPGATGPWYLYSTPSSGLAAFDTQCYPREFADVDGIWQTEHPMPEDTLVQQLGG